MAIIHTVGYAKTPVLGKIKIRNGKPVYEAQVYDEKKILDRILSNRKLGLFAAETCARHMNKFIPMDTGMLSQNFITQPFKVIYTSPYAHRVFYGEHFKFNKELHPLATAHWDKATSSASGRQIAKEIETFIKGM